MGTLRTRASLVALLGVTVALALTGARDGECFQRQTSFRMSGPGPEMLTFTPPDAVVYVRLDPGGVMKRCESKLPQSGNAPSGADIRAALADSVVQDAIQANRAYATGASELYYHVGTHHLLTFEPHEPRRPPAAVDRFETTTRAMLADRRAACP